MEQAAVKNLNLGCGEAIFLATPDMTWVNHDLDARDGVEAAHDLEVTPLPWSDGEFDIIFASHVLEHIRGYIPLVHELHRILKPGGTLVVKVPEFPSRCAVADPTHVRYFVPESFFHLCDHTMGHDTGGLKGLFELAFLESVRHDRPSIDRGEVGSYFTEIHVELVKREATNAGE